MLRYVDSTTLRHLSLAPACGAALCSFMMRLLKQTPVKSYGQKSQTKISSINLGVCNLPDQSFMYRRPTLCTLHIAVDFLKSLKIAVVFLGGGVLLGYSAYIISL